MGVPALFVKFTLYLRYRESYRTTHSVCEVYSVSNVQGIL